MISLEQIRALEGRVEKAVVLIRGLRGENDSLALRLADALTKQASAENRCAEFEARIDVLVRREAESQASLQSAEARVSVYEARAATAEARMPEMMTKLAERENRAAALEEKAAKAEARAFELENRAEEFRREQVRIEEGIVHALEKLDAFEDLVLGSRSPTHRDQAQEAGASVLVPLLPEGIPPESGGLLSNDSLGNTLAAANPQGADARESDLFADAVLALDEALGDGVNSTPDTSVRKNHTEISETFTDRPNAVGSDFVDTGAYEEEEAVWTPTAPATQEPAFPGAENELDIF